MSAKRMPFISSVKLARIDDSYIIPTVLYYEGKKPFIGREAKEHAPSQDRLLEDFKVELGLTDPDNVTRRLNTFSDNPRKTPVGLVKDFFDESIKKINYWLSVQGLSLPKRILIAEPLALGGTENATESWLSNYRKAIKRSLYGKFDEIDFMPEPFAVFQYYRYGLRHPAVAEQRKNVALVLDFGGGTFDVSVIETTKSGDISGSGVNSRPLGAKSVAIGGFYLNRVILEELLFNVLAPGVEKSKVGKSLRSFIEHKNADDEFIEQLNDREKRFFLHMRDALQQIERAKISVCNSIANWSLSADLSGVSPYSISLPTNPYDASSLRANVKLDAGRLRKIYEEKIWLPKLKSAISSTIDRAKADIGGQEISVVLLSGGSSNIRWLRPLLERDIHGLLSRAQILELSENFQEIVAKGLAIECARRFYTEGKGDFRAVTYNRLCLLLRSDDDEIERKKFRPLVEPLRSQAAETDDFEESVLLPTASSLRGLMDQPLRWKVKLSKPPKQKLDYFFMRSSFDPEDIDSRHNVADTRVTTPAGTQFHQGIEVELVVREDGTAIPKFIYGRDNFRDGTSVEGRPFYMDMTFAGEEVSGETYLGFDFGSSTSACSYVYSRDVQVIEQRERNHGWLELSDLVSALPYPAAAPLARYMSEMDQQRRQDRGREAVEALLTLATYVAYADVCSNRPPSSSHFKGFPHRSAGPLWGLLKQCLKAGVETSRFSQPLTALLADSHLNQLDSWISQIAETKHGKLGGVDYVTFLGLLGNVVMKVFSEARLGIFENVTAKRFSSGKFTGIFRVLAGSSQTFIHVFDYEGTSAFTDADVFIVNPREGIALNLTPLYVWGLSRQDSLNAEVDLFEFDSVKPNSFSFKAVQPREEFRLGLEGEHVEICERLSEMRKRDQQFECISSISLKSYDSD